MATKAQALDTVNAQLMALTAQSESLKMEMIALKDQISRICVLLVLIVIISARAFEMPWSLP